MINELVPDWRSAIAILSFAERVALTRLLEHWPRPVLSIRAYPSKNDPRSRFFPLGCAELQARGWVRVRRPADECLYLEVSSRALREVPQLGDRQVRARFIDEVKELENPPSTSRLPPERMLANLAGLAAVEGPDALRIREIRDALLAEAASCGFEEEDELLAAAASGRDRDWLHRLASEAVRAMPEGRFEVALASCDALFLLTSLAPPPTTH